MRRVADKTHPTAGSDSEMQLHSTEEVAVGTRIEHKQFGIGVVKSLDNIAGLPSISVEFKQVGLKKLLLQYARFKIID